MKFETLILLIIAFNVVTALIQRRAKKTKEREARKKAGQAGQPGPEEGSEPWFEVEEEVSREARPVPRRRGRVAARRAEPQPVADEDEDLKNPGFGRDILDQLARDLGLKKPVPPAQRPTPRKPAEAVRREIPRPHPSPASVHVSPRRAVPEHPPSRPYPQPHDAEPRLRSGLRVNLKGSERLREAFVLKEILDVPLARRRRGAFRFGG